MAGLKSHQVMVCGVASYPGALRHMAGLKSHQVHVVVWGGRVPRSIEAHGRAEVSSGTCSSAGWPRTIMAGLKSHQVHVVVWGGRVPRSIEAHGRAEVSSGTCNSAGWPRTQEH